MNIQSILSQFHIVKQSIARASIPFECDIIHDNTIAVSKYEIEKAIHQLRNIQNEISIKKQYSFSQRLELRGGD